MTDPINDLRDRTIARILALQDASFRWGFNEKQARERPEYMYYSPNFRSTLWTLVLLADLKAPAGLPQVKPSLQRITEHFFNVSDGVFTLPNRFYFPIPCLNGNMIYLHHYFAAPHSEIMDKTLDFFAAYQRFDDGGYKTPQSFPYCSNTSCYGRHTCYWGVTKLLKGVSFIPHDQRTPGAQRLLENCMDFILRHEVCFSSHRPGEFLHRDIGILTFPNFYKSDFLELLWLLAREGVRDRRLSRSLNLLRSRRNGDGSWNLEKVPNTIVPVGQKGSPSVFITARANEVLEFYGN